MKLHIVLCCYLFRYQNGFIDGILQIKIDMNENDSFLSPCFEAHFKESLERWKEGGSKKLQPGHNFLATYF